MHIIVTLSIASILQITLLQCLLSIYEHYCNTYIVLPVFCKLRYDRLCYLKLTIAIFIEKSKFSIINFYIEEQGYFHQFSSEIIKG